jgi:hypothetical protein
MDGIVAQNQDDQVTVDRFWQQHLTATTRAT